MRGNYYCIYIYSTVYIKCSQAFVYKGDVVCAKRVVSEV
jgi:hypothetical protein